MGIESFYTLQAAITPVNTAPAKPGVNAAGAVNNLDFLDMILAHLNENNAPENVIVEETAPTKEEALNLASFLAANPEIETEVRNFIDATDLGVDAALLQTLGLNQQAIDNALIPTGDITLSATNPEQKASMSLMQLLQIDASSDKNQFLSQINALKEKIQKIVANGDTAILTTNLTPEQITALQNSNGEWPKDLESINIALIAIVKPQAQETAVEQTAEIADDPALANAMVLLNTAPTKPKDQITAENTFSLDEVMPEAEEAIAARLNALTPGGFADEEGDEFSFEDFETTLKNTENNFKSGKVIENADAPNAKPAAAKAEQVMSPGLSSIQTNGMLGFEAGLFTTAGDTATIYDDLVIGAASTTPSLAGGLTSLAVQAGHASLPHPATQAVAFTIQKSIADGQNKTIALELDPPELGRLEIRMTFNKDKTMKAHVIAEKPETYMMLQRDSDTLQRILEASGLEGDGGLSFELAEHGFDFDQNNSRGGGHDAGGTGSGSDTAKTDIIESTMMWHVDPDTGHMRYNILA